MQQTLRQRIYQIFHEPDPADPITLVDNYLVPVLIAIDVAALILESFDYFAQTYAGLFRGAELLIIAIFTLEYLLRLWSCVENPVFAEPLRGRLRYVGTGFALVDLAAFLPFYVLNLIPPDWAVIVGPFFRLLRLLKLTRYSTSTQIFFRVLRDKRDELLTTLFVVMTLLIVASSLMYYVEREAQPIEFSSIPAAMWWGVITLTTVGYGDVHPITPVGKFLSAILAFLGIGVFALPARDIATAFSEEMERRRNEFSTEQSSPQVLAKETAIAPTPSLPNQPTNEQSTNNSAIPSELIKQLSTGNGISLTELTNHVNLIEIGIGEHEWLRTSEITIAEHEAMRLQWLQQDLQNRPLSLMNDATIWNRAIYPLMAIAEDAKTQARAQSPVIAVYPGFEIQAVVDGVLGQFSHEILETSTLVVSQTKRNSTATNPLVDFYLHLLAAASLNWRHNAQPVQQLYGCYTVGGVWTFAHAKVQGFDTKPTLMVEFSREFSVALETEAIFKLLKRIVRSNLSPVAAGQSGSQSFL